MLGDGKRHVSPEEIKQVYQSLPKGSLVVLEGAAAIVAEHHNMMIGSIYQWLAYVSEKDGTMPKKLLLAGVHQGVGLSTTKIIQFLAEIGAPIIVLNSNNVDVLAKNMRDANVQKMMPSVDLVLLESASSPTASDVALAMERKSQASLLSGFFEPSWDLKQWSDSRFILEVLLKHSAIEVCHIQHAKNSKTTISNFKAPTRFSADPLAARLHDGSVDGVPMNQFPREKLGPLAPQDQLRYAHQLLVARAGANDVEAVQSLLQSPAIMSVINVRSQSGETPLVSCALNGSLKVLQLLMHTGHLDVNVTIGPLNPLQMALRAGQFDIFKALLGDPKIDINFTTRNGFAALQVAIRVKNHEAIDLLLLRPELKIANPSTLAYAIESKNIEIVRKLLTRPDVEVNAGNGAALSKAIEIGFEEGVQELLKHPSLQISSESLWLALTCRNPSILKMLLLDKRLVTDDMQALMIKMYVNDYPPEVQQLLPEKYRGGQPLDLPKPMPKHPK